MFIGLFAGETARMIKDISLSSRRASERRFIESLDSERSALILIVVAWPDGEGADDDA